LPAVDSNLLDPAGKFVLYVSNQTNAIDPVDITVWIDGKCVVRDDFEYINEHNWLTFRLRLQDGDHELVAESEKGNATLGRSFTTSGSHWAVLNYTYHPDLRTPVPRQFTFLLQDKPMLFQ
jgi:hypothetical protein